MNHLAIEMKPSVMGREEYALGLELQKVWKQHPFMKQQVVFKHIGVGTNVQWVFVVQAEDDKGNFDGVPSNFAAILNAVNLEMIERPGLLNPPVTAAAWEKTTVSCRVQGADRKLVVLSFPEYARYLLEVQNVPFQYWELVRGVIGAGIDGFVYHPPHVRTPARTKCTSRRGSGKSPKSAVSLRQQLEVGGEGAEEGKEGPIQPQLPEPTSEEEGEEGKKEVNKRKKKGKKIYGPADFKFPQPRVKRQGVSTVFRSRRWFKQHHELIKLERNDPRPQQRAELRAAKQAAVERGEVIEKAPRKKAVPAGEDGCNTRVDCALNNLYNLEKHSRTGKCDYYQDYGHTEAKSVRVVFFCKGCKKGMHPECYYSYHAIRYGVYLDTRYEINKTRARHLARKSIPKEEGTYLWYKVPKDVHSSDDGYGSHGSQSCRPTLDSGDEADEEKSESGGEENATPNAACPV